MITAGRSALRPCTITHRGEQSAEDPLRSSSSSPKNGGLGVDMRQEKAR
jgi:hypothetical protein